MTTVTAFLILSRHRAGAETEQDAFSTQAATTTYDRERTAAGPPAA